MMLHRPVSISDAALQDADIEQRSGAEQESVGWVATTRRTSSQVARSSRSSRSSFVSHVASRPQSFCREAALGC